VRCVGQYDVIGAFDRAGRRGLKIEGGVAERVTVVVGA